MNLLIAVLILIILYLLTERRSMARQLKIYKIKLYDYMSSVSEKVDVVNNVVTDIKNKLDQHGEKN